MKYGLSDHTIAQIQNVFKRFQMIEMAILYGSRAKGNFKTGSDIDLTLIGTIDHNLLTKIELELDDLLLPYKIDLSVKSAIENHDLISHIDRVGVEFYKR